MSPKLDSSLQIHTLAHDLGLPRSSAPSQQIVKSVESRVRQIARKFACESLKSLLEATANEVGTTFREIRTDEDLQNLSREFVSKGELIFANLPNDICRADDFGITIALHKQKPWEQPFVSMIDCRGNKSYRAYFTKWHELAHLLTLTPQMRLVFRRSHSREDSLNPEEKLMDVIASATGFLPDFFPSTFHGELSFEAIAEIKNEFCPESSMQAATIGIVKAYLSPCILLQAEMALKKAEAECTSQLGFGFRPRPNPSLRATRATVNTAARDAGVQFFNNWRVPAQSIIAETFATGTYGEANEDLAWWETSTGRHLEPQPIRVKAQKIGDAVHALLVPSERKS
jgi:hypothetical protein